MDLAGRRGRSASALHIERDLVHFDLTDVRVAEALETGREGAHRANYTAFEIAYLRAHWVRLGSKVTFWHEGKTVPPPW